jgi:hypothetical protein
MKITNLSAEPEGVLHSWLPHQLCAEHVNTFARTVVMLAFFAGMIAVFYIESMISRRHELEKERMEGARYDEVIGNIESIGAVLKVSASSASGIWTAFFFLIFGLLCCLPIYDGGSMILGGAFCFLLAFHSFMVVIPRVGRPVLVLGRSGFETPEYGFIPWFEVDGIHLLPIIWWGELVSHDIVFHVPGLARYRHQFSSYQALLFRISSKLCKNRIRVKLLEASEQPTVIRNVADDLLQKSSGREYVWSASVSDKENEVYGRLQELFKKDADLLKRFKEAARNEDEHIIEHLTQLAAQERISVDEDLILLKTAKEARQNSEFTSFVIMFLLLIPVLFIPLIWVIWKSYGD